MNKLEVGAPERGEEEKKGKQATVVINGQPKVVEAKELSFEQLVSLAYDGNPPSGENWEFTITYRKGEGRKPQGSLQPNESVKVKDGMIFNVTGTDKS